MNKKPYMQPATQVVNVKMDTALLSISEVKSQGLNNEEKLNYSKEKKRTWNYAM